ncbi:MAG: Dabb family protein [Lachnospiraceae bacterium]|nr:Dabb family protein [Lachnospiraceae bacterium]
MNKHIVLWAIKDDDNKQEYLEKIRKDILDIASAQEGCLFAEVGFNYSMSDYDLCFIATFKNPPAIKQFVNCAAYKKVLKYVDSLEGQSIIVDYMPEAESTVDKTPTPEPKIVEVEVVKEVIVEKIVEKPVSKDEETTSEPKKTTRKRTTKASTTPSTSDEDGAKPADTAVKEEAAAPKKTTRKRTTKAASNADAVAQVTDELSPKETEAPKTPRKRTTKTTKPVNDIVDVTVANSSTVNAVVETIVDDVVSQAKISKPVKVQPAKPIRPKVVEPEIVKATQPGVAPISAQPINNETPVQSVQAYALYEDDDEDEDEDELPVMNRANLNALDDTPLKRIEPKGKTLKDGERAMATAWRCPVCGKFNGEFVGLCGCGARRPDTYIPVSAEELEARMMSEADFVPEVVYKNNIVPPSFKEYNDAINETIVPAINNTIKKIKTAAGYEVEEPKEEIITAFTEIAANASDEPEIIRIEPKGVHLEDGQMAMSNAWKCTKCGKINGAFVGLCGCGRRKPKNYIPVPDEELKKYEATQKAAEESAKKPKKESNLAQNLANNISTTFNNVKTKSMNTLTEAMNSANNLDSGSYNKGLLGADNSTEESLKRIEPKGIKPADGESAMKNSWTCPKCGKVLASYIGQCGCGARKNGTEED